MTEESPPPSRQAESSGQPRYWLGIPAGLAIIAAPVVWLADPTNPLFIGIGSLLLLPGAILLWAALPKGSANQRQDQKK